MGTKQKNVSWYIFAWIVAIVTTIIGFLFAIQITLMTGMSEMKSDISSIKTDIVWIKNALHQDIAKK